MEKVFLFPLNNSLLLRKITLPYHIFEPRYKQMIHDSVKTNTPIAVVPFISSDKHEDGVCVAGMPEILNSYPDGRMDIYITGQVKCLLKDFKQEDPYKIYTYEPLKETSDLGDGFEMELESLKQYLVKWAEKFLPDSHQQRVFSDTLKDPETLINYGTLFLLENMDLKKEIMMAGELSLKVKFLMSALGPKEISLGPYMPKLKL